MLGIEQDRDHLESCLPLCSGGFEVGFENQQEAAEAEAIRVERDVLELREPCGQLDVASLARVHSIGRCAAKDHAYRHAFEPALARVLDRELELDWRAHRKLRRCGQRSSHSSGRELDIEHRLGHAERSLLGPGGEQRAMRPRGRAVAGPCGRETRARTGQQPARGLLPARSLHPARVEQPELELHALEHRVPGEVTHVSRERDRLRPGRQRRRDTDRGHRLDRLADHEWRERFGKDLAELVLEHGPQPIRAGEQLRSVSHDLLTSLLPEAKYCRLIEEVRHQEAELVLESHPKPATERVAR